MYAIQLTAANLDAFQRATLPDPVAQRGEVLVRMRAASLNYIDLAVATGAYPVAALPLIPVADGSGEIVSVGEDVAEFTVGDRVIAHAKPRWIGGPALPRVSSIMRGIDLPGSLAELVALPANALVKTPGHLDDVAAATLPIVATTAWNAMTVAQVGPASSVLLLGTGGVSIMALQFAKALGARTIVTSSSEAKLERARQLGADATVNYAKHPEWEREVLELTNGRGVDLVIDTGGTQTFARSVQSAAVGGTVFTIGFISGSSVTADLMPIIVKGLRVQGNNTGSVADLRGAVAVIEQQRIVPVVDKVFELADAAGAYRHLRSGGHFGKVAIEHR